MKNKFIVLGMLGMSLVVPGSASAIVVGGVDFGALGLTNHIETTTVAETYVNAVGQTLTGYGQVNTVNGTSAYAGGNSLYFTFTYNVASFSPTSVTFDNGVINMYLRSTFNLLNQGSLGVGGNLDLIDNGTLWATFNGHNMNNLNASLSAAGTLTGDTISFNGSGLVDIVGGLSDVVSFMNVNNISDGNTVAGFADVALTTSGNNFVLNQFDDITGCDASPTAGQWCIAGSADYRGKTHVPEPETLALLGIGLLGMGGASLRRRKAA